MQSTTAIDCKVTRQTDKVNDKYIATIQKKKTSTTLKWITILGGKYSRFSRQHRKIFEIP